MTSCLTLDIPETTPVQRNIYMSTTMQKELSENVYGNVCYPSQGGDHFDEVYANQETARTQTCNESKKKEDKKGAATTKVRCYRVCVVSLGLLCVLLLAAIIWMFTKHTAERDQQQRNMDLLQLTNNNLTQERDHLLARSTSLSKVDQENNYLRDQNANLITEKNDLRAEMEKLQRTLLDLVWADFGTSFYHISANKKNWADSQQACMEVGGHLVIIDTDMEQNFIYGLKKNVWIGLSDIETEGKWKWVNGKVLDKAGYWMKGEPNDQSGNEDCVEILTDREPLKCWNDYGCNEKKKFICEKEK